MCTIVAPSCYTVIDSGQNQRQTLSTLKWHEVCLIVWLRMQAFSPIQHHCRVRGALRRQRLKDTVRSCPIWHSTFLKRFQSLQEEKNHLTAPPPEQHCRDTKEEDTVKITVYLRGNSRESFFLWFLFFLFCLHLIKFFIHFLFFICFSLKGSRYKSTLLCTVCMKSAIQVNIINMHGGLKKLNAAALDHAEFSSDWHMAAVWSILPNLSYSCDFKHWS